MNRVDRPPLSAIPSSAFSTLGDAIAGAQSLGVTLVITPGTTTTDCITISSPVEIVFDKRAVVKLQNAATETSNVKAVFHITSDDVRILNANIDVNRAGQDKSAFNTAGGAAVKTWVGIFVEGADGSELTGIELSGRVINSPGISVLMRYADDANVDLRLESGGAGLQARWCDDLTGDIRCKNLDNDGWKIYPHAIDLFSCNRSHMGLLATIDQFGDDNIGSGGSLSNYVSGITMVDCVGGSVETMSARFLDSDTGVTSVGVSLLSIDDMTFGSIDSIGWSDLQLEMGGVVGCQFSRIFLDGKYRRTAAAATGSKGWSLYNNGYYGSFSSRSQRFTENNLFGLCTVIRNRNEGVNLSAARNNTWTSLTSNANRHGLSMVYVPVDTANNFSPQVVQDLTGNRFLHYDFSYNEGYGLLARDGRRVVLGAGRAINNGQSNAIGSMRNASGSPVGDAAGLYTLVSSVGSPLEKSEWVINPADLGDDQSWSDLGSAVSTAPTILSVASDGNYHIGQSIKLTGAGAAGVDLTTRIDDKSRDELTLHDAISTFPTTAGTGTVACSGTTVTGVATSFIAELKGRYWITVSGQTRQIINVTSDTAATVSAAFSPSIGAGASFVICKITTAGIPSQLYGAVLAATLLSPEIIGPITTTGVTTAGIADNTVAATQARYRSPYTQSGSKTFDWASIASGAEATTTVTVRGAALGDIALASMSVSLQAMKMTAFVSATDTVTVVLRNDTGGAIDLASGTLTARVVKG